MPHDKIEITQGMLLLLRDTPLTNEEWLRKLEARRQLIVSDIDNFALRALGNTEYRSRLDGLTHKLSEFNWQPDDPAQGRFHHGTRGIFGISRNREKVVAPAWSETTEANRFFAYGILYTGDWMLAEVHEYLLANGRGVMGQIRAERATLQDLLAKTGISPLDLLDEMTGVIKRYAELRQSLALKATSMYQTASMEDRALREVYRLAGQLLGKPWPERI